MAVVDPLIELRDVNKHYGTLHVLQGISLTVGRGEVVVVIGPSGSGKSTLCRAMNRLEAVESGEIIIDGQPLPEEGKALAKLRAEVGMVFQSFNLFAHKTVLADVALAQIKVRRRGKEEADRRSRELLDRVGLAAHADKYPGQLSGGQQLGVPPTEGRGSVAPRPRHGPQGAAPRRADLRPRPRDDQRGPGGHAATRPRGHEHGRRHPRDGLRPLRRQPGRLHGRRPHRRGPHTRGVLHQPAQRTRQGLPVQDPQPLSGGVHHTHRTRRHLTALALPVVSSIALVACGKEGSPPVKGPQPDELPVHQVQSAFQLPDSPTWERAKKRGHLVVGAKEDQPYMGEKDPATGRYSGFDIEIAKMLSASLGFDPASISFRTIASANRETALQNGQIDYYVGTHTINDNRKKLVGFAGPYYMAGQSLLVRTDENDIHGPQDLDGKRVCSAAGSTPYQRIEKEYPKAELVAYDTYSVCVDNLLTFQVDAVTTDDSILLGYAAKVPDELEVLGTPFSQEPYGIGVPRSDNALRFALDDALAVHERNGDWRKAYDVTLGLSGVPAPQPPPIDRYPAS